MRMKPDESPSSVRSRSKNAARLVMSPSWQTLPESRDAEAARRLGRAPCLPENPSVAGRVARDVTSGGTRVTSGERPAPRRRDLNGDERRASADTSRQLARRRAQAVPAHGGPRRVDAPALRAEAARAFAGAALGRRARRLVRHRGA